MSKDGPRTEACEFIPPHEPWTCRVHQGIRTRLDEPQCDAIRPVKPLTAGQLDNLRKADAEGRVPANRYIVRGLLAALAEAAAGPRDEPWDQRSAFATAERALAVPHREDDQPCGCDECMAYGAEDASADWYRFPVPNRIVIRALDSGDDRLAPLARAIADHEAASSEEPVPGRAALADTGAER